MDSVRLKYIAAIVIFAAGALLAITPALTKSNFELLIPGVILVALSAPFVYYFRAKSRSSFRHKTDEEIITGAKREAELRKGRNQ